VANQEQTHFVSERTGTDRYQSFRQKENEGQANFRIRERGPRSRNQNYSSNNQYDNTGYNNSMVPQEYEDDPDLYWAI